MYRVHRCGENSPMFGKKHTEDSKRKISENHADFSGSNHPNYGKHCSEDTRKKISMSNKGKVISNETKRKLSNDRIGRIWINNGISNKSILKEDFDNFDETWKRGKIRVNK